MKARVCRASDVPSGGMAAFDIAGRHSLSIEEGDVYIEIDGD